MASSNTLTAEQIENDPNFKSFLSYTEAPDMDNTSTNADNMAFVRRQHASKMQGSMLLYPIAHRILFLIKKYYLIEVFG